MARAVPELGQRASMRGCGVMGIRRAVMRVFRRDPIAGLRQAANEAKHPFADAVALHKAEGRNIWLNCTLTVAPGQKPVEFGIQIGRAHV